MLLNIIFLWSYNIVYTAPPHTYDEWNIRGLYHYNVNCYNVYYFTVVGLSVNMMTVQVHLVNSVYVLLNLAITHRPTRLQHAYQPLAFLLLYATFSVIYYLSGGLTVTGADCIYPFLDWDKPGYTLVVGFIVIVCVFVIHFVFWAIYKLRTIISRRILVRLDISEITRCTSSDGHSSYGAIVT